MVSHVEEEHKHSMSDWRMEEQRAKMALNGLSNAETGDKALDAQRIFELANKAYSLYVSQNPAEKAKLLRMLFSNCSVDAVSVTPTYRKPFDMISKGSFGRMVGAISFELTTLCSQNRSRPYGNLLKLREIVPLIEYLTA